MNTLSHIEDDSRRRVVRPLIGRLGGKSRVATAIVGYFPPHKTYVEPMVGGGSVFFAKPRSEREVIADLDPRVVTLFRAAQAGTKCKDEVASQEAERKLIAQSSENACDIVAQLKCSFAKKGNHPSREADYPCKTDFPPEGKAERLQGVEIEQGDFRQTMKNGDSPQTLHYLDPPYVDTKNEYGPPHDKTLDNVKLEEVRSAALSMQGKVIISYNDVPKVREVFCKPDSGFQCHEIEQVILGTSKGALGVRKDLVIIKD